MKKLLLVIVTILCLTSCNKEEIVVDECANVNCESTSSDLNNCFGFFSMIWLDLDNPTINGSGNYFPNFNGEMVPDGELINHNTDGTLKQSVIDFLLSKADERDSIIQVLDDCCGGHELYWREWYDDYWW